MDDVQAIEAAAQRGDLSPAAQTNLAAWLTEAKYAAYQPELTTLIAAHEWKKLEDAFFMVVPFGTGGRRGTVGIGPNRINRITIGESAQGLAAYIAQQGPAAQQAGVVIGYDTRTTSQEFAQLTAQVLAANGCTVYLFDGFRATPELSFAVRHLATTAGVVISASHNPPSDNGFKAYWSDGGQIVPPHDAGIMAEVARVGEIRTIDFAQAITEKKITMVGPDIDAAYVAAVCRESVVPARGVHIMYSPLHGSGSTSVLPVLTAAGFTQVSVVASQATPDGNFPNIENNIPNPEVRSASAAATKQAQKEAADVAITTDPDADRLGVVVRTTAGDYQFLNGNQIAALLCYHVLHTLAAQQKLTPRHFVVKTIVTTDLITALAEHYRVHCMGDILIGFKYVAELIRQSEGTRDFIFGGEESHGILKGTYTRDKDAAVAALLLAELAATLKESGKTLVDLLHDLYREYGVYTELLHNIQYPGAAGSQTMATLMTALRTTPPLTIGEYPVVRVLDRQAPATPGTKGNVLIFHLSADGRTRVTARPSGTEPKLKIYTQLHTPVTTDVPTTQAAAAAQAKTIQDQFVATCAQLLA